VTPRIVASPYDEPGTHDDPIELPQLAGRKRTPQQAPEAYGRHAAHKVASATPEDLPELK